MTARTTEARRWAGLVAALALVLSACSSSVDSTPSTTISDDGSTGSEPAGGVVVVGGDNATPGQQPDLGLQLSEGAPGSEQTEPVNIVVGEPLTDDDADAIFDRLPPWDVPADDQEDFNRPAESLKPPLVGDTIGTPFPPAGGPGSPTQPPEGPLEVLRFQPEGEVAIAPFLSVTFNQPMVPLATLQQLDEADVPIEVTPSIEGRWRWIGTRTLRFELVPGKIDRLPAATEYTATVPAGTTSVTGGTLADDVSWTFATPAPVITSFVGESQSLPLEPVFVAVFDQRVDPDAVLATITFSADGEEQAIRLATDDEIAEDESARQAVSAALPDRAVAFRATETLPVDTPLLIEIGPGTPSAEGPRTTTSATTFSARTYPPLRVDDRRCGYGDGCKPLSPISFEFSNAIDAEAFTPEMISVDPAIPGLRVNLFGSVIELTGATKGRTTYDVTLSGDLRDVFGQTLGDDQTFDFDVGRADPSLRGLERQFITTDPVADEPTVSVFTINHDSVRVTAWAVQPDDYTEFQQYLERTYSDTEPPAPDWPEVMSAEIETSGDEDAAIETAIDLTEAFDEAEGMLVVRVESTRTFAPDDDLFWQNRPTVAWVQSTPLAVDVIFDNDELLFWTTDLVTGEPVGNVDVALLGTDQSVTTDGDGIARTEFGSSNVLGLVATSGGDTAFLPSSWFQGWEDRALADEGRWYVFDDRGIYRPGETVRLTGWVRRFANSEGAQLALYGDDAVVGYQAWDPQGNDLGNGELDLNALGGFNLSLDLPEGANLGQMWIEFTLSGSGVNGITGWQHTLQIQEFRTPEFEVTARQVTPPPYYTAKPATVAVDAEYFAGGPLPDAEVEWTVTTRTTTYDPPNWDDFTFGIWQPWWFGGFFEDSFAGDVAFEADVAPDECFDCGPGFGEQRVERFSGRTDAGGSHFLQIAFEGPEVDLPSTVTAEAAIFDVNRQAFADRTDLLVHPARFYVGLRSDRTFVEQGTPLRIDAVLTDVDGELVPGREFEIAAGRLEWAFTNGQWGEVVADTQTCTLTSTGDATDESMRCEFDTEIGGTYRITGTVADDDGGKNRSELTQWVTGGTGRPNRGVDLEAVTIVPDRETYEPGDTAELLVQAPFAPASGLVTVARNGIESTETFDAPDGSAVVQIPITDEQIPNVTVQIDMTGSADRVRDDGTPVPDVPKRPAFATGQINLSIPPMARALDVTATPDADQVEPGSDTSVTVGVVGPDGQPVSGANVAVVVVDEAVLALTGYDLDDPLDIFYRDVQANITTEYLRSSVVLTRPDLVTNEGETDGGDDGGADTTATGLAESPQASTEEAAGDDALADADNAYSRQALDTIDVRADFDALAVYAPDETTGADGTVTVAVPLPDSLTRYRVMAVAIDGADKFGKGESSITARLPLMVRPSAPRFLNFGDTFELPVVVQNQTNTDMTVDVAIQVSNLTLTDGSAQRVVVPANDRVEVRFPAAADEAGTARFRVAGVSGEFADATTEALPVYTPATAEAFATYGVVDEGTIGQPVLAPEGVFPQFGGLEINTSSTALQALTDAVLYLYEYRYDSSDGYASRIMAVAALRDVLDAFDADGLPDADELNARVQSDIQRLAALQNDDGGFPYWQRGRESVPWQSIQATHALVLADQAGYDVPSGTLERALTHIGSIEEFIPANYSQATRDTLSAYALYVRNLTGDRDTTKALDLHRRAADSLQFDALAWIWPVLDDASARDGIERKFQNAATETPGAATFATSYGEDAYLIANSDRRTDGIVLDALITETPDSDLIPKVVAGLLGNQTRGRWNNAHENAFILLAMNRYFDTFESVTPDFVARAWLGDLYAAEHEYRGRTTDRSTTLIPMNELVTAGDSQIVLQKDGEGRLYYRLGLRYAPDDLQLDPRDEGFVVERVYEGVDDPDDVRLDDDGVWHIKAGASVRVRLTMVADARRTHVALIDPLPAGLEPLNPALVTSPTPLPEDPDEADAFTSDWCWCWNWFEHQNLRDDRAEAFTSFLPGGTYEYTYVARATTPGQFVVPPARAEEIYAPEVFGRSASGTVIVEG